MVKGELDGAVDGSSANQDIGNSNVIIYGKSGDLHLAKPGLTADRQSGR